jgi:glyoxylase-like metal-dependent hydrolase (beta-lactamase superfamily II)
MQGAAELGRATGAKIRAHADDRMLFEQPEIMEQRMGFALGLEPAKIDAWLKQGDRLAALGTAAEVRHVPGHCPGNVLFYFAAARGSTWLTAGAAFVGDALFNGGIGRTDLPGGDFEQLENSIRTQIYTLPDATTVYPGHGPDTTVGAEKAQNPYVSA